MFCTISHWPARAWRCSLGLACGLLFCATALAQSAAQPAAPTTTPTSAPTSRIDAGYTSAITQYLKLPEQAASDWRAANDKVRQIGGWRAYAKMAAEPETAESPAQTMPKDGAPHHHGDKP